MILNDQSTSIPAMSIRIVTKGVKLHKVTEVKMPATNTDQGGFFSGVALGHVSQGLFANQAGHLEHQLFDTDRCTPRLTPGD